MRRLTKLILSLLLAAALTLSAVPAGAALSETGFPDVPSGSWYENQLRQMQLYTPGIISGYYDKNGVLIFDPDSPVQRGQFLRMIMVAAEGYTADKSRNNIHWAGEYYTIAMENNVLIADVYEGTVTGTGVEVLFPCTYAALQEPISRYEMAVILNNVCTNMLMEKTIVVEAPETGITDYAAIDQKFATAVEQSCGKGLLSGYEDGAFRGDQSLRRCEAASVIYRLLWSGERKMADWAEKQPDPPETPPTTGLLDPSLSFANWLRNGHIDAWGNLDQEAKNKLFGAYAYQGYFASSAQAAPYMANVSVPIWTIDRSNQWASSSVSIMVNKAVAEEVRAIFQMIYNYGLEDDSRKFPIYGGWSAGGARYSDRMRHSWGCAIDVNALYNCECNFNSGYQRVTCGYGWWPADAPTWWNRANSAYHGTLTGPSVYSISPDSIVVKAFATYGWGWLGNGFRSGNNFDFMHFSVLPSGG